LTLRIRALSLYTDTTREAFIISFTRRGLHRLHINHHVDDDLPSFGATINFTPSSIFTYRLSTFHRWTGIVRASHEDEREEH
jgi:hypothetical protein